MFYDGSRENQLATWYVLRCYMKQEPYKREQERARKDRVLPSAFLCSKREQERIKKDRSALSSLCVLFDTSVCFLTQELSCLSWFLLALAWFFLVLSWFILVLAWLTWNMLACVRKARLPGHW